MATHEYDLAIIGGGSAGLTAAKVGRFFAKRVAMVDKQRLGGDCLYYGCVPSKALIKAARVMHEVKTCERWGLRLHGMDVTLGTVNGRVQQAISDVGRLDSQEKLAELGVDVFLGGAAFRDQHTLATGEGETIRAKYILIATGSRPAEPAIPGLAEVGYWTNEDLFDLQQLPGRLAVIGGGPIGVEMAQAFHRLGSKVTVLQKGPHLIPRDDADMIGLLERSFINEGIDIAFETAPVRVRAEGNEKVLELRGGREGDLRVDAILVAVGRTPNIEDLQLDNAGITYTAKGIPVNERLQTSRSHIYAAGDVTGGPQFTHYAGYMAAQAVRNLFLPIKFKFEPGNLPWVTFTDPEVGHVGVTEAEARAAGKPYHVIKLPYSELERAVTDQDAVGLMKFIIDDSRKIIGCHIAGAAAGEMINEITLAMNNDLSVDKIIGSIHAYPTYSFGIPIALYDFVLNEEPTAVAKLGRFLSKLT